MGDDRQQDATNDLASRILERAWNRGWDALRRGHRALADDDLQAALAHLEAAEGEARAVRHAGGCRACHDDHLQAACDALYASIDLLCDADLHGMFLTMSADDAATAPARAARARTSSEPPPGAFAGTHAASPASIPPVAPRRPTRVGELTVRDVDLLGQFGLRP